MAIIIISLLGLIILSKSLNLSGGYIIKDVSKNKSLIVENDTTKAIRFCISYAIDSTHMPSVYESLKESIFCDSILLTSNTIPLKYLPSQVDSFSFKIMKEKEIEHILLSMPDEADPPNYLCVRGFEKTGNTFTVTLVSISSGMFPSGGGSLYEIEKVSNTFRLISSSSSSIN